MIIIDKILIKIKKIKNTWFFWFFCSDLNHDLNHDLNQWFKSNDLNQTTLLGMLLLQITALLRNCSIVRRLEFWQYAGKYSIQVLCNVTWHQQQSPEGMIPLTMGSLDPDGAPVVHQGFTNQSGSWSQTGSMHWVIPVCQIMILSLTLNSPDQ